MSGARLRVGTLPLGGERPAGAAWRRVAGMASRGGGDPCPAAHWGSAEARG